MTATRIEYLVLGIAVLAFLVLLVFQIGPAPLMLLPWLVVAVVATHLITRNLGDGDQGDPSDQVTR